MRNKKDKTEIAASIACWGIVTIVFGALVAFIVLAIWGAIK